MRRRSWAWPALLLGMAAGFVLAAITVNALTPVRAPPVPVAAPHGWIGAEPASNRLFLRTVIDLPFRPRSAWIGIATDDYTLYVNGRQVERNAFSINAGLPFQYSSSQRQQGVNPQVLTMVNVPDTRIAPNREWRAMIYSDLSRSLTPGRNVIAISLQTAGQSVRIAIDGEITGDSGTIRIDGAPSAWHASTRPDRIRNEEWNISLLTEDGWASAVRADPPPLPVVATAPPRIWASPQSDLALTAPVLEGHARLARVLPALSRMDPVQSAWVRVFSPWPYDLFVDDELVGSGGAESRQEAMDLTRFLRWRARRLSLVLHQPRAGGIGFPQVVVDAGIGDTRLGGAAGWLALQSPHPGWLQGQGSWAPAQAIGVTPGGRRIAFASGTPGLSWAAYVLLTWAIAVAALAILFRALRSFGGHAGDRSGGAAAALWLLSIPCLVALGAYLLRLRYRESDQFLDFLDPGTYGLVLLLLPLVLLVALLLFLAVPSGPGAGRTGAPASSWLARPGLPLALTFACAALAFYLRMHEIGIESLQADENVSLDAARGVLRTGLPFEISGVLYTRSPLYHYMLAGWLSVFGDSAVSARTMSVIPGVAIVFAVYRLAYLATGSRWLGVLCALLIAVDPWQINQSRNVRFYQQMQFCGTMATLFFLDGFIRGRSKRSQNWFFFWATLAVLSQEVFVLLFPGYCIAAFCFYRPFSLRDNVNVILGFGVMMTITLLDLTVFTLACLTRNTGVSTSVSSIIQPHLFNPTAYLTTLFVGQRRANLLLSLVFLAGLPFWLRRSNAVIHTLYILVLTGLVAATVLVMQIASRYVFPLYPLMLVTVIATIACAIRVLAEWLSRPLLRNPRWYARTWAAAAWSVVLACVAIAQPFEALGRSYGTNLILEHERGYRWIQAHRQPGDVVISVSPMAGAIVLEGVDYYIQGQLAFDEVFMTRHAVRDRWGGGTLISKIDMLRDVLHRSRRAWIMIDQPEERKFSPDFLAYVRRMTTVTFTFLGGEVRLWDPAAGRSMTLPHHGGEIDNY